MKATQEKINPQLNVANNNIPPAPGAAYIGMDLNQLNKDTIISYDLDGQPIRLGNLMWDLPTLALTPIDKTKFNYSAVLSNATHNAHNILTIQIIMATEAFSLNNMGEPLRVSSIRNSFEAIRWIVRSADKREITVQELIHSTAPKEYLKEIPKASCQTVLKLINNYLNLTTNSLSLIPHRHLFEELHNRHCESRKQGKQTPVIPSRILHERYHHYNNIIIDFVDSEEKIRALVRMLSDNPYYGRDASKTSRKSNREQQSETIEKPNFAQAICEHQLEDYCSKHKIKSTANLSSHIGLVQHCAKSLVHIYTLVRDHEAKLLEENCIQTAQGWNSEGLYMMGVSTKLTGTVKDTAWIANKLVHNPIKALIIIKSMISPYLPPKLEDNKHILVTPSFLPFCGTCPGDTLIREDFSRYEKYLPPLLIEEADVIQLEAIDPLTDWRTAKKYRIGNPWKITSHQFRRTMTVFGAQSKILDIPELKRLLTHVNEYMSLYYQRGCSAGGYNMSLKSPELAKEINGALKDAEWISYLNDVLYSTEKLHGGHGERVTTMNKANDPDGIIYRQTAEETMQKAKKGLISYQRTPLGGCTSNKPCNERAHGNFTNCFGCASSVLKVSNVESVIEHAKIDLLNLDPKSFEYRMEQRNIQDYEVILSHLN